MPQYQTRHRCYWGGDAEVARFANHRIQAVAARQVQGSAFKLFPYLVAIDRGVRPKTPISASPIAWGGLRYSLDAVVRKARDFGITTPIAAVPGLVLGQSETLLL